jgi:S-adenosyl-L-methionine hydrolase (adenosine-forming)
VSVITLCTDFGVSSPYAAVMKGVILGLNPAAVLVDLTHAIRPQDIRQAAIVLDDVSGRFPAGTLHVAVVDPGVGTDRAIVFARLGEQNYLCPDNGLLSRLAQRVRPTQIVRLTESDYWLKPVSDTFHGRDIMAPVAARLSLGLDPARLGVAQERLADMAWPEVLTGQHGIDGSVLLVDSFGNLSTNITAEMLAGHPAGDALRVVCKGVEVHGLSRTYAQHAPGELVAVIGSSGRLELAVVNGNAAVRLRVGVGETVSVQWG